MEEQKVFMPIFNKYFSAILIVILPLYSYSVYAATWKIYSPNQFGDVHLEFKGEIVNGDASKLASIMVENGKVVSAIHLNSLGGSVTEAIKIGEMIKSFRLDTYVQKSAKCASACFFMWINGSNRAAGFEGSKFLGLVGLHRPYLKIIENTNASVSEQAAVMRKISSYLDEKLIPRRLTDLMLSRASNEIYWLKSDDLDDLHQSPPDNEELYISKCGDNRRAIYSQMNIAKANGNTQLLSILNYSVGTINDCIDGLNQGIRSSEIVKLMKNMQKPSNNVKM